MRKHTENNELLGLACRRDACKRSLGTIYGLEILGNGGGFKDGYQADRQRGALTFWGHWEPANTLQSVLEDCTGGAGRALSEDILATRDSIVRDRYRRTAAEHSDVVAERVDEHTDQFS